MHAESCIICTLHPVTCRDVFQLKKELELERADLSARHSANVAREIERAKKATEEQCKEVYMTEMKKLGQEHKEKISLLKKKQWVSDSCC